MPVNFLKKNTGSHLLSRPMRIVSPEQLGKNIILAPKSTGLQNSMGGRVKTKNYFPAVKRPSLNKVN